MTNDLLRIAMVEVGRNDRTKVARDEVNSLDPSFTSVVSTADRASFLYDSGTFVDLVDVARPANNSLDLRISQPDAREEAASGRWLKTIYD